MSFFHTKRFQSKETKPKGSFFIKFYKLRILFLLNKNQKKTQLHLTVDAFILSLVDTVFLDVRLGCCPGFKDPCY